MKIDEYGVLNTSINKKVSNNNNYNLKDTNKSNTIEDSK